MTTHHLLRSLPALALATCLFAAPAVTAYAADADLDGDGVADAADDCPDTPPGDIVGADGCSLCPCDGTANGDDWASRKAYVDCVGAAAKQVGMSKKARRAAIKRAKAAACGNANLTRCCINPDTPDARCKVTTADKCDALGANLDVDDRGMGSCAPSPCNE